jgi:hypothetical protein
VYSCISSFKQLIAELKQSYIFILLFIVFPDQTMSSTTLGQMLSSLSEPSFGIPTDVTFQIMHFCSSEVVDGKENDEIVLGEVKGHKLVLGLLSSVFKQEFFGPAKETKDIIPGFPENV